LNDSIINLIEDETIILNITISNLNLYTEYKYYIDETDYSNEKLIFINEIWNEIYIKNPKKNFEYNFSLHYKINSENQEVKNIIILGVNNYLNFSISIDKDWNLNFEMEKGYEDFSYYFERKNEKIEIWIFDPSEGNRNNNLGHVFNICLQSYYSYMY
jgi:hypothetical protein